MSILSIGFSMETMITDSLAALGLLILAFSQIIFVGIHRRVLNGRLHTVVDGNKLFEKLKYDLKLSKITGVDRIRLYKNKEYALTIFRGAMEYNSREVIWYFNEMYAKQYIASNISKKAWLIFLTWAIFIGTALIGSHFDILNWLFDMRGMASNSGIVSIWVLTLFGTGFTALIKFLEYKKVKIVINDEVRQINLAKKEKVWNDYKIIFWSSVATWLVGWLFIIINIFF